MYINILFRVSKQTYIDGCYWRNKQQPEHAKLISIYISIIVIHQSILTMETEALLTTGKARILTK
jgi:hypothetical protein